MDADKSKNNIYYRGRRDRREKQMNTVVNRQDLNVLTESIIDAAFTVSNILGNGFLEKVYENALVLELKKKNIEVEQQKAISVYYEGQVVGEYFADLFIENSVIVELKVVSNITKVHEAQLINYLKATDVKIGLILNFAETKVGIRRMVNRA